MALDAHVGRRARPASQRLAPQLGDGLAAALLDADQSSEAGIAAQRERVVALRQQLAGIDDRRGAPARDAGRLPGEEERVAGRRRRLGLRHRLRRPRPRAGEPARRQHPGARHRGLLEHRRPASKATPLGAAAKFAAAGKPVGKKDLGLLANMYGHVYVARVAFGAKMAQTAQAFLEAESYDGPSLIIAYSHCIAHGYDMAQRRGAAEAGGRLRRLAALPLRSAARSPRASRRCTSTTARRRRKVADYMRNESRFRMVERADPARYKAFVAESQAAAERRYAVYQQLAGITVPVIETDRTRSRPTPDARRRDGSQHHLPRDAAAASADRRRRTARRRSRHGAARSKTPAPRCSCCARSTRRRSPASRWTPSSTSRATASRSPRRAASSPSRELALGPDEYLEHLRQVKARGRHPGDGVAQRRHARRLAVVRAAARAGRRRRPRAAHLPRRQRHDDERGRGRAPVPSRSCAR